MCCAIGKYLFMTQEDMIADHYSSLLDKELFNIYILLCVTNPNLNSYTDLYTAIYRSVNIRYTSLISFMLSYSYLLSEYKCKKDLDD